MRPSDFLQQLHQGHGITVLCHKAEGRGGMSSVFFTGQDSPRPFIAGYRDRHHIWFGVNPLAAPPESGRGSEADVGWVVGLWIDLDTGNEGHKKANCPPDKPTALEMLSRAPLEPTWIVDSGHGFHGYWLFSEPVEVTDQNRDDLKGLSVKWQHQFRLPPINPQGYHVDNTADLSRILRLPGTLNHKTDPPRPVEVVGGCGQRYPQEVLSMVVAGLADTRAAVVTQADLPVGGVHSEVDPFIRATAYMAKRDPAIEGQEGDRWTYKTVCKLMDLGLDDEQAMTLLLEWNQACQPPWTEKELRAKVRSARRSRQNQGPKMLLEGYQSPPAPAGNGGTQKPPGGAAPKPPGPNTGPNEDKWREGGYPRTDLGNAEAFRDLWGHRVRHVAAWGTWLLWTGRRWETSETSRSQIGHMVNQTIRFRRAQAEDAPDQKAEFKHCYASESAGSRKATLDQATTLPGLGVSTAQLDGNPWLLNVANGVIDLKSGQLRPHDPDSLLTQYLDVEFKPDAPCPTWTRFLHDIFLGQQDLIAYLQRAVGYALTGSVREQCMFILHGSGSNGKSTLVETLTALFQEYSKTTPPSTFMASRNDSIPNDLAALKGARLVTMQETGDGKKLDEALIKRCTGGDTIQARFLHQEWFEFKPSFKLWLSTNHKPRIDGTDHGIWRRLRLLPFDRRFEDDEKDPGMADKLLCELPGILAWAVEGCLAWQLGGLQEPEAVLMATEEYRGDMDVFGFFLDDCCQVGPDYSETVSALYSAYKRWCDRTGHKACSQTLFGRRLSDRGFNCEVIGKARTRARVGLRLIFELARPEELPEDELQRGLF